VTAARALRARQAGPTAQLAPHADYVSDLALAARERCLLAVSGDGTLSVTDLRTSKVRRIQRTCVRGRALPRCPAPRLWKQ